MHQFLALKMKEKVTKAAKCARALSSSSKSPSVSLITWTAAMGDPFSEKPRWSARSEGRADLIESTDES